MTVTFGTAKRSGRDSNNADTDAQKKLFIDPDAVVSVPAGLRLWAPENGVVFNGPVNFTTSETDFSRLVLFANIGIRSKVEGSGNLQNLITVNGVVPDWTKYLLRFEKSNLVMKKRRNCRIILR